MSLSNKVNEQVEVIYLQESLQLELFFNFNECLTFRQKRKNMMMPIKLLVKWLLRR